MRSTLRWQGPVPPEDCRFNRVSMPVFGWMENALTAPVGLPPKVAVSTNRIQERATGVEGDEGRVLACTCQPNGLHLAGRQIEVAQIDPLAAALRISADVDPKSAGIGGCGALLGRG